MDIKLSKDLNKYTTRLRNFGTLEEGINAKERNFQKDIVKERLK